ncbi:helix-turn-helix domain-containing protein [Erythrobacter aurantius]|uniref:helix-turn-helix domain-containing protein n=1 Tax=Erythrobacter aurantius TaxID=2909249 RepID=UPI00207AED49|nr:helix-turn-helix domain-containing protein [Erythrobacter aurantius]
MRGEYCYTQCDLFGAPIPVRRGRGRPAYVPDEATRRRVVELRRGGATAAAIAVAIGIGRTTLYQFYGAEVRKENDDG